MPLQHEIAIFAGMMEKCRFEIGRFVAGAAQVPGLEEKGRLGRLRQPRHQQLCCLLDRGNILSKCDLDLRFAPVPVCWPNS